MYAHTPILILALFFIYCTLFHTLITGVKKAFILFVYAGYELTWIQVDQTKVTGQPGVRVDLSTT